MMSLILYFPGMYFIEHVDNILIFTRRVPLVEQELLTFPEYLSSTPFLMGYMFLHLWFSVYCCVDRCLSFVLFLSAIVLSFFDLRLLITSLLYLRFTASDYPPFVS